MSTPERETIGLSSRLSTPRSRRQSRTPVGTPSRRRATIVSASLVTPRRSRRVTMTPQNTLRMLSRALVREKKESKETENDGNNDNGDLNNKSSLQHGASLEALQPPVQPIGSHTDSLLEDAVPEWRRDFYGDELDNGYQTPEYGHESPTQNDRVSPVLGSQLYSDIAIPQGIVPDEGFLFQDAAEYQPLHELPSSQIQFADEEPLQSLTPPPQLQRPNVPEKVATKRKPAPKVSGSNRNLNKFAKSAVVKPLNAECFQVLSDTSDLFLDQISRDLKSYTEHASKKTIDIKSLYLLFKRQRFCDSIETFLELADEALPLEDVLEIRRNVAKLE